MRNYPDVALTVNEMTTSEIELALARQELDAALLATPIQNNELKVTPLFYEKFFLYANSSESGIADLIHLGDLDKLNLWLLNEGHCLRTQVINFCGLRQSNTVRVSYETGSVETLKRLVETSGGATILPELACNGWHLPDNAAIFPFEAPVPGREISLVTYRHFVKLKLTDALKNEIMANVPPEMTNPQRVLAIKAV